MFEDKIEALLENASDLSSLARGIYKSHDEELVIHLIHVGLEKYRSQQRNAIKRKIKDTILSAEATEKPVGTSTKPAFDYDPKPSIKTQRKSVENAVKAVKSILQSWSIGGIILGDATKDILLHEAKNEYARGKGHVDNARFYERLALPMNNTETVKENKHWQSDEAVMLIRREILEQSEPSTGGSVDKGGHAPSPGI